MIFHSQMLDFKILKKYEGVQKYRKQWGFPGSSVVKDLPAMVGDTSSIPSPGRSHMPWSNEADASQLLSLCSRSWDRQLLSLHATTSEATHPKANTSQQTKPATMRSPYTILMCSPCLSQLEKSPRGNKDPAQPKIKLDK